MAKPAKQKKPAKGDEGNLRLEAELKSILDSERAKANDDPFGKSLTDLEVALPFAADGWVDPLRDVVVKIVGAVAKPELAAAIGLFINYPKGERGQKLRRMLFEAIGQTDPHNKPTLIQEATRTKQRIQHLFNTKYTLQWRREHGVTWSAAYLAARYWLHDDNVELHEGVLLEDWVDALVQQIEQRDRQSKRKHKRPASK